jgi:hypothetical protein
MLFNYLIKNQLSLAIWQSVAFLITFVKVPYFIDFSAHFFALKMMLNMKGFKMAFMMNKLAMINSCEIILEK